MEVIEKELNGFKAFHKDLKNRYGYQFEIGKTYTCKGNVSYGNYGNGFHFCERLEDTFRYVPALEEEICVCKVIGSGNIVESCDEYYGYYGLYSCRNIKILKQLTRQEILKYALDLHVEALKRLIVTYKLNIEEIKEIQNNYKDYNKDIHRCIEYHQFGNRNAYDKVNNLER